MVRHEDESTERKLDLRAWARLFGFALRYKRDVALLAATAVLTAATEGAFPLVTRRVIDDVVENGANADLAVHAASYGGLTLLFCCCVASFITLGARITSHVSHDIRETGFERLQELSFSFYDQRPTGWLMARMTSDCDRLSRLLGWGVLDLAWGLSLMVFIASAMVVLDWRLGLIALSVVPALAWVSVKFQRLILRSSRRVRKINSRLTASYNEGIMGVRTSKVSVREDANLRDFQGLSVDMEAASVRTAVQSAMYPPVVMTLGSLGTGLALWLGGMDVVGGVITIGTLIAFISYTVAFFDPVQEIALLFAQMQMAQAAAERVLGLIDTEPEIRDSAEVLARLTERKGDTSDGRAIDGGRQRIDVIEFRDVDFAYGDGPPVLDRFGLSVRAGERIALVGPTGGGKTSIVSLLCRFYEPTSGGVLLDGVDYRERSLAWWQGELGIVQQEPHLFSGSIRDNIRYARLDATDAQVQEAAELAQAHAFITELPEGYATEVGEGGTLLSTGQKQLISCARALLADPQVLVLDEATSSVDAETERRIQVALERVLAGRTSFVIAHRLSTIRSADRILFIEGGRIVEQGNHEQLVAAGGRYRDLYSGQRVGTRTAEGGETWAPA